MPPSLKAQVVVPMNELDRDFGPKSCEPNFLKTNLAARTVTRSPTQTKFLCNPTLCSLILKVVYYDLQSSYDETFY